MKVTDPVGTPELPDAPATVAVKETDCPTVDGFAEEVTTVVVEALAAAFTTWVTTFDVDPLKFESPLYSAVIEYVPAGSVDVLKLAAAEALSGPLPKVVVPFRKLTVPVGTVVLPEGPATVAVNKILLPAVAGFGDDTSVVVVAAVVL